MLEETRCEGLYHREPRHRTRRTRDIKAEGSHVSLDMPGGNNGVRRMTSSCSGTAFSFHLRGSPLPLDRWRRRNIGVVIFLGLIPTIAHATIDSRLMVTPHASCLRPIGGGGLFFIAEQ